MFEKIIKKLNLGSCKTKVVEGADPTKKSEKTRKDEKVN